MFSPEQIHRDCLVFDAHCDFLSLTVWDGRRFDHRLDYGHLDLPRLLEGGLSAQMFAIFTLSQRHPTAEHPTVEALRQVEAFYRLLQHRVGRFVIATCATEIERAKVRGEVAGVLSMEGCEPLAGDIALLRLFYQLGVRCIGLTWNRRNAAADGIAQANAGGLTEFGRLVVKTAFQLGMLVDVAHLAAPGVADVLQLAEGPVIASHANAYALCPHPRNLNDAQLEGIARCGGVVCVTFVPAFITTPPEQASLERLLDHVDYIARCIGTEHIGIGSDFDGYDGVTAGLEDVTRLPALTAGLVQRGYTMTAIRDILGGNLLRVFRQVVR
ncbi:MAG: dipeptidase [Anaerolineae bacterium]